MGILDFAKKKKEKNDSSWVLAEGNEDGMPMLYRMKENIPEGLLTEEYPRLISILWEYEIDNTSGMPSDILQAEQRAFDDALDEMDNKGLGIMMLAVTGNGRREWVWYTKDQNEWLSSLHHCLENHPAYPLDIEASDDPEWETWKAFRYGAK